MCCYSFFLYLYHRRQFFYVYVFLCVCWGGERVYVIDITVLLVTVIKDGIGRIF